MSALAFLGFYFAINNAARVLYITRDFHEPRRAFYARRKKKKKVETNGKIILKNLKAKIKT